MLLVGGAVRDLLLGHTPKDYDLLTSAHLQQVCAQSQKRPRRAMLSAGAIHHLACCFLCLLLLTAC